MRDFKKNSEFLICIDNDGTVMDTMTLKHKYAIAPAFFEIYDISDPSGKLMDHWIHTNLYTKNRGVNRFIALKEMIQYLHIESIDEIDFFNWVTNSKNLNINSLEEEIEKKPNSISLNKALVWARLVNDKISKLPDPLIFDNAKSVLDKYAKDVDFVGVSTANLKALVHDWTIGNVIDDFRTLKSQEDGVKSVIIKKLIEKGYKKENVLMVGDASGDFVAAKDNDINFFPMIPGDEPNSWIKLDEAINKLINHNFDINYQNSLMNEFNKILN